MKFFSCIAIPKKKVIYDDVRANNPNSSSYSETPAGDKNKSPISPAEQVKQTVSLDDDQKVVAKSNANSAHSFTLRELAAATRNFRDSYLIGEGGFGKVYKGCLDDGTIVAIKKLSLDSLQGNEEFMVEVLMLSLLHHPNLVTLNGYCAEGDQRLLVYEYMSKGSLADHLFDHRRKVLDWSTRMKIAVGAARGLEYLHCQAKPPVIYRDLKSANILLDKDYYPKLSDFGLAKLGPMGENTHVSTRVMGTYGYCAPEYALSGKLTLKSDIFSFGVLLLEIVTGRKAYDTTKKQGQQSLVAWARPFLRDRQRSIELVDPQLTGKFPSRSVRHLIAVTTMCLHNDPSRRPSMTDLVVALDFIANECLFPSASSSNSLSSDPLLSQNTPNEDSPKEQTQKEDDKFCEDEETQ